METKVIEGSGATFQRDVVERSHQVPVVVDFWAPWCGPCRTLGPVLEKLAEEGEGSWVLVKIDTDQNQQLATDYMIRGIPAVKAFVDGKVVDEFTGARPESALRQWLRTILPSEADEALAAALEAEAAGDFEKAAATLEPLVADDSENAVLRAALARCALASGEVDAANDHLAAVPDAFFQTTDGVLERAWIAVEGARAKPDTAALASAVGGDQPSSDDRFRYAMILASEQRYEESLQLLIDILATDRAYEDDLARIAMIRVFEAMGAQTEAADRWRVKMGRVMY